MKIELLHNIDALGPPKDPVLDQITSALVSAGHEVGTTVVSDEIQSVVTSLTSSKPDLVFNLTEGFAGKSALDSNIAALLNLLGLRYTGSSPAGLILAGDKSLTKKVLGFHGIGTPEFATLYRGSLDHVGNLSFPLIVKPPQEDASLGISTASVVHNVSELLRRMDELQDEYPGQVLVEEFIEGREFYVGVIGNLDARALPVIEMDFTGFPDHLPRVASYKAKWGDNEDQKGAEFEGTRSIIAEGLSPELQKKLHDVALAAFEAMRLRDYARIDLRADASDNVYVIEVNPNCYLEKSAEFARSAECSGLNYDDLIERIVELAAARYAR